MSLTIYSDKRLGNKHAKKKTITKSAIIVNA